MNGPSLHILKEFIRYALVGGIAFVCDFATLVVLREFAFCSLLIVALLQFLRQGFACLVPAVPLMAYLIGTSLLMFDSGAGDFRFFWAVEMTYPLALAWCFIPVRRSTRRRRIAWTRPYSPASSAGWLKWL